MNIGGVELTITSESIEYPTTVTSRPVEGGTVSDNIKIDPIIINVTGVCTKEAFEKLKKLRDFNRKGELVTYSGRNVIGDLAIEVLNTTHNANIKNGFSFSATLKQVRRAKFQTVQIQIQPQVKKVSSAGRVTPKPKKASPDRKARVLSKYEIVEVM